LPPPPLSYRAPSFLTYPRSPPPPMGRQFFRIPPVFHHLREITSFLRPFPFFFLISLPSLFSRFRRFQLNLQPAHIVCHGCIPCFSFHQVPGPAAFFLFLFGLGATLLFRPLPDRRARFMPPLFTTGEGLTLSPSRLVNRLDWLINRALVGCSLLFDHTGVGSS